MQVTQFEYQHDNQNHKHVNEHPLLSACQVAERLRAGVEEATRLTCSCGVAPNQRLAKASVSFILYLAIATLFALCVVSRSLFHLIDAASSATRRTAPASASRCHSFHLPTRHHVTTSSPAGVQRHAQAQRSVRAAVRPRCCHALCGDAACAEDSGNR